MKTNFNNSKTLIKSLSFIEELCWLLDSRKNLDFPEVIKLLKDIKYNANMQNDVLDNNDLVGILPRILVDTTLFKTNRSLWQFSKEILSIDILNWEKRSRNEMIGVIICKIQESPEASKGVSTYLLENILINKDKFEQMQKEKERENNPFLWNDAIRKIVEGEK